MAGLLSEKDQRVVKDYVSGDQKKRAIAEMMAQANQPSNFEQSLTGQGAFRDTGRASSGPGEAMDSLVGVPVRTWADDAALNGVSLGGLLKAAKSVGTDPRQAPTGVDVADHMGIENPYAGAAMATAVDMASLPIPGGMLPGVAGTVARKAKGAKTAQEIVEGIQTAEQAVALKGAEREAYLAALDQVYGERAKRAADMGYENKKWYHGSPNEIAEFKTGKQLGEQSGNAHSPQVFFTDEPATAKMYGKPIEVRTNRSPEKMDQPGYADDMSEIYQERAGSDGLNVRLRGHEDMTNERWLILPDGQGVRRTDAAFDPRFADSPLLLAGRAGLADAPIQPGLMAHKAREEQTQKDAIKRKRKKD